MITGDRLAAKDPSGIPVVIKIGRISTDKQSIESIEASFLAIDSYLEHRFPGTVMKFICLSEQASGMLAERDTIEIAFEHIRKGKVDLVIAEDLSRIFRHPTAMMHFVFRCVDANVRVIAVGDGFDTANEHWFESLMAAPLRHGMHVADTRRRVRRSATYSFKLGGMVTHVGFGHRKLTKEEAMSGQFGPKGLRVAKEPSATPILHEMRRRVLAGDSAPMIACWLNEMGIAPGPKCKLPTWSGKLVKFTLRNPLHCGIRLFRKVLYAKLYATGKPTRNKNAEPDASEHPELAHFSKEEFAELQRCLDARNGRKEPDSSCSLRRGVARKDSIWPGQQMRCGICGAPLYRTLRDQLKCANAFPGAREPCWNRVMVHAETVRSKVLPWLFDLIKQTPSAWDSLIDTAWDEIQQTSQRATKEIASIDARIREVEAKADRLADQLAKGVRHHSVKKLFASLDAELAALNEERTAIIERAQSNSTFLTREEVAKQSESALMQLARTSYRFAQLLRQVIPRFAVYPVQSLDSGLVRPQGRLVVDPCFLLEPQPDPRPSGIEIELRLFDPPVHIRHALQCAALKAEFPNYTLDELGKRLSINRMSVKRALAYSALMQSAETREEYKLLQTKPAHASRWKTRKKRASE
jgi:hypothetical protein